MLSQCVEKCDSSYILIPFDRRQRMCFYPPTFKDVRRSLGQFGTYPPGYVKIFDDARFVAMCLDSRNLEASQIRRLIQICQNHSIQKGSDSFTQARELIMRSSSLRFPCQQFLPRDEFFDRRFPAGFLSSPNPHVSLCLVLRETGRKEYVQTFWRKMGFWKVQFKQSRINK
jgi:hypothetical protein